MNKNIVLIATGGGEFILPKLSIPWWNSQTEKQEIATIEPVKLMISGAPAVTPIQKALATPEKEVENQINEDNQQESTLSNTLITLISIASLLLLLLLAWLYKNWREKSLNTNIVTKKSKKHTPEDQQKTMQKLRQACVNNNALDAKNLLDQWAQSIGNFDLKSPKLQDSIKDLNHALYGKENRPWQGSNLWQAVDKYHTEHANKLKSTKNKHEDELESLYL